MPSTLQRILEDVLDNLEDSGDLVSTAGGRLDDEDRSTVADHLAVTLARIDETMAHLAVVGEPDTREEYGDLELVAKECVALAQKMLDPAGRPSSPSDAIANNLQTIKYLIERVPGGFRSLAGLE